MDQATYLQSKIKKSFRKILISISAIIFFILILKLSTSTQYSIELYTGMNFSGIISFAMFISIVYLLAGIIEYIVIKISLRKTVQLSINTVQEDKIWASLRRIIAGSVIWTFMALVTLWIIAQANINPGAGLAFIFWLPIFILETTYTLVVVAKYFKLKKV